LGQPLSYGILRQKSPDYRESEWELLDDLYFGGFRMRKNAERHIPRIVGETEPRYRDRIKSTSYLNYFGQIVDYFVAALFSQDFTLTPSAEASNPNTVGTLPDETFYQQFSDDCDMRGTRFANLLRKVLTTALCKRTAFVVVDMPVNEGIEVVTRYEEEQLGLLRAYVFELPNEQIIDWLRDDTDQLIWAVLNRCSIKRLAPEERRGNVIEEFKIWRIGENGYAQWELYRIEYAESQTPKDDVMVECVAEGMTSFTRIPILKLEMPSGLCVGDKISMVAQEHYQRRSALNAAQNKSLVSLPVAKLGPEISSIDHALPSEKQQDPFRGDDPIGRFQAQGFIVVGKDDDITFAEPHGMAYQLIDKQIQELKDELFRVVQQMAASISNDAGSLRRSAESKKMDRFAESIVLSAMGQAVRTFGVEVYECVADARGEHVVWQPHGLDHYSGDDRDALLSEAVNMDLINIPSTTWQVAYKTNMAMKLMPNLAPEVQEQVRVEIEEGLHAKHEQDEMAEKDESENGMPVPDASASDVSLPDDEDDEDDEDDAKVKA